MHRPNQPQQSYRVRAEDTLFGIALKHHMRLSELKRLNRGATELLYPGQMLNVLPGQTKQEPASTFSENSLPSSPPAESASLLPPTCPPSAPSLPPTGRTGTAARGPHDPAETPAGFVGGSQHPVAPRLRNGSATPAAKAQAPRGATRVSCNGSSAPWQQRLDSPADRTIRAATTAVAAAATAAAAPPAAEGVGVGVGVAVSGSFVRSSPKNIGTPAAAMCPSSSSSSNAPTSSSRLWSDYWADLKATVVRAVAAGAPGTALDALQADTGTATAAQTGGNGGGNGGSSLKAAPAAVGAPFRRGPGSPTQPATEPMDRAAAAAATSDADLASGLPTPPTAAAPGSMQQSRVAAARPSSFPSSFPSPSSGVKLLGGVGPGGGSDVLSGAEIESLEALLPLSAQGYHWRLLYSSLKHGSALGTFYTRVERQQRTLLAVQTVRGEVFGGFTSTDWTQSQQPSSLSSSSSLAKIATPSLSSGLGLGSRERLAGFGGATGGASRRKNEYFGSGESFLYALASETSRGQAKSSSPNGRGRGPQPPLTRSKRSHRKHAGEEGQSSGGGGEEAAAEEAGGAGSSVVESNIRLRCYPWTGANQLVMLATDDFIALGGGGGSFGLRLDEDLSCGSTGPCETFGNAPLVESSPPDRFEVAHLEVWGFAVATAIETATATTTTTRLGRC